MITHVTDTRDAATRGGTYPESYHRRAVAMYRDGHSHAHIADELGVSRQSINRWLIRSGVHEPRRTRRYRISQRRDALRMYRDGHAWSHIEDTTGVVANTAQGWRRDGGMPPRTHEAVNNKIIRLRREGRCVASLADEFSLSTARIYMILAEGRDDVPTYSYSNPHPHPVDPF